ncbi:signal peptide peptidase SppA [Shewanella yunxiaonensis]|uniref:Signal peptide peptidase SppA n=1 Tax=Shewanella yunxiaonensis TaxID=2829809 RepID=A0ABX7YNV1_9GAMM|nr:signal peptide peptidase SppA [Shewanella yunxiaonensis]QUN04428.1 signal peptide peptidase SppA [Shewanella yunxiaonensis]
MSAKPLTTKNTLILIWNVINFIRKLVLNLVFFPLFFLILIVFTVALFSSDEVKVDDGSALVLDLAGRLVDQKQDIDPLDAILKQRQGRDANGELLLSDVLYNIDSAANDKRISALVLDLGDMAPGGITKIQTIGRHIEAFKKSGKPVIAMGNYYNQYQYLLATYADTIYLNPQGMVTVEGLSSYRQFYKSALDKLKINTHVFRVGTYKSAVEPFIRDDMSDAAKEANTALLNDIWDIYTTTAAKNRGIQPSDFGLDSTRYLKVLNDADGQSGQMALDMKWVDKLATADQFRQAMIKLVGKAAKGHSFKQIDYYDYASLNAPATPVLPQDGIGIVVAKGNILNGNQPAGTIGGDSTSALLRKARFDDKIKAVVLRVDSPGGSAFASEQIRQEVLALKAAGKPVVVSMSSLAASGGYWISASADYIYANPATLTGSIGIFGMLTTFEDSLAALGVHTDGVATTDWANLSVTRPLSDGVKAVIQRHIERGYHDFISLVAKERHMTLEQVDKIAQGRVWSGIRAKQLGLVDDLGDEDAAIAKAAELAGLSHYDTRVIEKELTPEQLFMQKLLSNVAAWVPPSIAHTSAAQQILTQLTAVAQEFASFDDPNNVYLYCDSCNY